MITKIGNEVVNETVAEKRAKGLGALFASGIGGATGLGLGTFAGLALTKGRPIGGILGGALGGTAVAAPLAYYGLGKFNDSLGRAKNSYLPSFDDL